MSNTNVLNAITRSDIGKGASRRLRREQNLIPAIVYGAGKPATSLSVDHNKVIKFLECESVYSSILTITVDEAPEQVVLKALQRHPYKPKILHMDFMRIDPNAKLHMHVPLHFTHAELSPGIKDGGIASHSMTDVEVICLPKHLPEFLEVNIGHLELDGNMHLSEIALPEGVELSLFSHGADNQNPVVVSIHKPRALVEEVAAEKVEAAESEAPAEGGAEDKKSE